MTFRAREWHHGYLGCGLFAIGVVGHWPVVWASGLILVCDDVAQHFLGVDPSPIHRLYVRFLWPLAPIQKLNRWLDKVMS